MTTEQFNRLDRTNKLKMMHQSSIELDYFLTKFGKPLLVTTYSLNGIFIEMVFDFYDRKFKSIQAYDSSGYLEKYPDQQLCMKNLLKLIELQ